MTTSLAVPRLDQRGFSLIEVLTAVALIGILVTLSASSFRTYWLGRSLDSAQGEVKAQLQRTQEQAVSESQPFSFGVRFQVGSSRWDVVRYNPTSSTCTVLAQKSLGNGVIVSSGGFDPAASIATSTCPDEAGSIFVWYFARGTATAGTLTLRQPVLDKERTIEVVGLTGKVLES